MGKIAAENMQLNAIVSRDLGRVVQARSAALSMSRGKFTAMILERWKAEGFPPVSKPDELMRASVMEVVAHNEREAAKSAAERADDKRRESEIAWAMQQVDEAGRVAKATGKAPQIDPRAVGILKARRDRQRKKR